jgi:FMN phosphatase YigB (HAD superfamily)
VLGRRHGLADAALDAAFTATRGYMLEPGCALEVPAGYADLLAELRAEGVRVVLATNSPAAGLDALLRRLDVLPLVDAVVSGTGKPAGLSRLLRREVGLAEDVPAWQIPSAVGARLLVIGDHWRNDIQPGLEIGAAAAYIDRFGRADGPAGATGRLVEDLLDTVRDWAGARLPAERN